MARLRTDSPNEPATPNKRKKPRFVVYRNEDGSLDTDHLSPEDRAAFEGRTQSAGPAPSPVNEPAAPVEPVDPAVIGLALNLLTSIEAAVVGQKMGIPHERVYGALQPKPPLDQMVVQAACKVANKYAVTLGPYADEIALVAMLATWQISAFNELRAIAFELKNANPTTPPPKDRDADRHQSPATPPPSPEPKPAEPAKVVPIDMLLGAQSATGIGV